MYGGSSVNSIYCLQHETASAVLERALNEHSAQKQLGLKVTVLNFGLPSSSVLQNMHSFLMFQPIVRPDIVVCLDGYNDLYNGVRGDRILLNKYYMAYSGYIEPWSRRGALVEPPNKVPIEYNVDTGTTSQLGNPRASVRSYLERKRQFMTMVEGMGGRFVWALQPIDLRDTIRDVMALMLDLLYARFEPPPVSIDLHQEFLQRPDRDKIFESVAHMSPYGESLIGARLADVIVGNGLLESR
jgi:hypothetical protein